MADTFLADPFYTLWAGKDPFHEVEQLSGKVYREKEGRVVFRVELDQQGYFVKIHRGIGWRDIFKNLLTLKAPVLGAYQEWLAIKRLNEAGIATMTPVGFGQRGLNPARLHSFLLTEELAPTVSLEEYCQDWLTKPPAPAMKFALTRRVAAMTAAMHAAGVNHRDCYLCHFLIHTDQVPTPESLRLSIIDLHRAQVRSRVPVRWRDKDLAGLYFSALSIGLTRNDKLRFLKFYFQKPLREILIEEASLLHWMERKAVRLLTRYQRKYAPDVQT
jgi:heptose I phosphotransferase